MSKSLFAQDEKFIDSLKKECSKSPEDTNKFYLLSDIAWEYIGNSPEKSLTYSKLALELSLKLDFQKGTAKSLYNIGVNYYNQGSYTEAILPLIKTATLFEKIGHKRGLAASYNSIGNVYKELKKYALAIEYQKKAITIQESIHANLGIANSLNNIGNIYLTQKKDTEALTYYNKSLEFAILLGDKTLEAKIYNNLGFCMRNQNKNNEALAYYLKSISLKEELNSKQGISVTYSNVGHLFVLQNEFNNALVYFKKSLELANESSSKDEMINAYQGIVEVYSGLKNYDSAFVYQKKYIALNDSVYNVESTNYITELQAKYQTEKKEREIEKLNSEKENQQLKLNRDRIIIFSGAGGSILLLILALLFFNILKQKQTRRRMLSAVIETEEKERKRFAEDLHDGLGPLLSSISLYVNELKSDKHEKSKKSEFLNYSTELIDEAIKSTRMIANNLMPGILSDYGLFTALNTFCDKIQKLGGIHIKILSNLSDKRYEPAIEITLYRVLLELINNTLKHASASNISIDFSQTEKSIFIVYADDGIEFNVEKTMNDPKKGLGLNNSISRIKSIAGKCEYISSEGKGTKVKIEVNFKKYI